MDSVMVKCGVLFKVRNEFFNDYHKDEGPLQRV
jgi:hypothetical protein